MELLATDTGRPLSETGYQFQAIIDGKPVAS